MAMIRAIPRRSSRPLRVARSQRVARVGITQMACSADPEANLRKQLRMLTRAVEQGAQIVCTQELFASQYFCQSEDHGCFGLAESIPGPSTDALCAFAKQHQVVVIGSLFEKRAAGLYHNTAVVFDALIRFWSEKFTRLEQLTGRPLAAY